MGNSVAPAPPTSPSEVGAKSAAIPAPVLPEGYVDPKYGELVQQENHALETSLRGDKETFNNASTNAAYQRSLINKQEPLSFKANEGKANSEGLLESGVNAQRRGTLLSGFVDKGNQIARNMEVSRTREAASERVQKENWEDKIKNEGIAATERGKRWALENPPAVPAAPAAPGSAPANPGGVRTVTGPPGAGGVPSYTETLPGGGFVRVGPGVARAAAAKRYEKKGR